MELSDLSLNQIHILAPVSNDSLYEFPLKYKEDNDDKEIIFKSRHVYRIHLPSDEDSCELHIGERTELKFFSDLYNYLNKAMYDIHENYFESSFERKEYNKLFKNYLFPNIEENAVNIYCHIEPSVLKEHLGKKYVDVIPTFHLKSIVYDQPSFYIALELKDVEDAQETSHEETDEVVLETTNVADEETKELPNEETQEFSNKEQDKDNSLLTSNIEKEKNILHNDIENTLEEVHINNNDNMEKISISLNDEDYFILFKIIQSNIKENFYESFMNIFENKDIETKNINIQDIVYDSENEESEEEDEILENENFERDYKRMV